MNIKKLVGVSQLKKHKTLMRKMHGKTKRKVSHKKKKGI